MLYLDKILLHLILLNLCKILNLKKTAWVGICFHKTTEKIILKFYFYYFKAYLNVFFFFNASFEKDSFFNDKFLKILFIKNWKIIGAILENNTNISMCSFQGYIIFFIFFRACTTTFAFKKYIIIEKGKKKIFLLCTITFTFVSF